MIAFLTVVAAFLLGSIPFGLLIGKWWTATDVRRHGSGNIGTSNVLRTVGRWPAIIVLLYDLAKGAVPIWFARYYEFDAGVVASIMVAAVLGHIFSVFLRFKGGKGIATAFGVAIALDWRIAVALAVIWVIIVAAGRYISVASVIAAVSYPLIIGYFGHPSEIIIGSLIIGIVAVIKHQSNIRRIVNGEEFKIGQSARAGRVDS